MLGDTVDGEKTGLYSRVEDTGLYSGAGDTDCTCGWVTAGCTRGTPTVIRGGGQRTELWRLVSGKYPSFLHVFPVLHTFRGSPLCNNINIVYLKHHTIELTLKEKKRKKLN